jgi:hypothetical protein
MHFMRNSKKEVSQERLNKHKLMFTIYRERKIFYNDSETVEKVQILPFIEIHM